MRSYIISDILLKCGVLFISVKVFQNLHVNKLTTPHFLYLVIPVEELGGNRLLYDGMETENIRPIMQWLKGDIQVKDWSKFIPDFPTLPDNYQIAFLRTIMQWHKCKYKEITRDDLQQLIVTPQDINIGVYFVVKTLLHLMDCQSFPTWNDMYSFIKEVSPYSNNYKILSLDIGAILFDQCRGKYSLNWYNDDYLNPHDFPNFSIKIETDYSSKTYIQPTKDKAIWQKRLSLIKQHIPTCQYDVEARAWSVPSESYMAVIQFAKEQWAILTWGKDKQHIYRYNWLDKTLTRNLPVFCEGRYWEDKSKKLSCWWCYGDPCYENNIHQHNDINEYTLYDFIYILGLQEFLRCKDVNGYIIPDGDYIKFMSVLNWINRSQEHLYCKECGKILEPYDVANYHTHTITEFKCDNPVCSQKDIKIYLNHCFNGQCQNIIDSREAEQCPNGMYICFKCGVCCSNSILKRKVEIGLLSPDRLFQHPHWENQEFYCPKCGGRLSQIAESKYKCPNDGYEIKIDITNSSRQYTRALKNCIKNKKSFG